jgi:hypothetical protein
MATDSFIFVKIRINILLLEKLRYWDLYNSSAIINNLLAIKTFEAGTTLEPFSV